MRRRDFLTSLAGKPKRKGSKLLANLEKKTTPLTKKEAYHLLRRVSFAPTLSNVTAIEGKTPDEAVSMLLGDGQQALPDGYESMNWLDTAEYNPLSQITEIRFEIESRLKSRYREFNDWWLDLMRKEELTIMEKLTLFWSTVWTIEFTYDTHALIPPPLIYRNNQTLRGNRIGNYKKIVEDITLDGAMLLYQSLHYSTVQDRVPNENYMREMLELFTMGIGQYTEGDIKEGSRVLTGWRTSAYLESPKPNGQFNTYFSPVDHDIEAKQFMGRAISARNEDDNTEFQVLDEEVRGLINIMFEERGRQIAEFVSTKIYRYFVYSDPGMVDEQIVSELSDAMVSNNYELKPVFEKLFTSKYFYSDDVIGGQIKTPPDYIVGVERMLGVDYPNARGAVFDIEQVLYDPPDVGSWPGYRTWISTKTYPRRVNYALEMLDMLKNNEITELAQQFENYGNPDTLIDSFIMHFLPVELSEDRKASYKNTMLNQISQADWKAKVDAQDSQAVEGIKNLLTEIFHSPDFQLC